ncbi:MAG: PAS domain-containing protein [Pseudomonadales bacterium]|nr:PAS domain-containing protein [Pseudomonadales bacterium]
MNDMQPDQIVGEYVEHTLNFYDGSSRKILVTEIETEFPKGCLIVSRTDTSGVITHCNESFVKMSGYAREELIDQPHSILRHPDIPPAAFADLWNTLEKGEKWNGYVKNLRKDGGYYWVYVTAIPNIRNSVTQGYTSVRREPSRKKVEECIKLYPTMF